MAHHSVDPKPGPQIERTYESSDRLRRRTVASCQRQAAKGRHGADLRDLGFARGNEAGRPCPPTTSRAAAAGGCVAVALDETARVTRAENQAPPSHPCSGTVARARDLQVVRQWAVRGSNARPPACKKSAGHDGR
jgi:hypothetical protein